MQDRLSYIVGRNEYITNWLTGKLKQTPFEARMVPMVFENYHPGASVKDRNGKELVSPAKKEFLEKGIFRKSGCPENEEINDIYMPFDTKRVDFSGFWHFPCDITFYARAYAECKDDCRQEVELCTCGAVKVWVNGEECAAFYPYEANLEARQKAVLPLKKGTNEILAGCNNYGERNIVFNFGIKNLGPALEMFLPISADTEKLASINAALEGMYLDRQSYESGNIVICMEDPFPYDCILETDVCGIHRKLQVKAGMDSLIWGSADSLPIGYHEFTFRCYPDGCCLSRSLWAEVYPVQLRIMPSASVKERKQQALDFIVKNTQPTLEQYIAWLGKGENRYEEYQKIIESAVTHVQNRGDCSDFRVAKIVWILIKFRDLLTAEQITYLEETLLRFRYWFDEKGNDAMWFFSENHALCFHTGQMIAGELFADRIFSNSGLTGRQLSRKAKKLIVEWFQKLLSYGYNEWNSAAYIPVDMLSYITLLELCQDFQIRRLAQQALDYTYEIFAKNCFKGMLGTSNGRTYPRDLLANKDLTTNPLTWLAWGEGCLNSHTEPLVFMALSDYEPPCQLCEIAGWDKKEKLILSDKQGTLQVPTTLCKTKDYILGTCISPRTGGLGSQEHLLNIFLKDDRSRIWINHPGEGKIFGQKRPGYFTGNGLTPLVTQRANAAVMSYRFDDETVKSAEVNFTHVFCDLSVCDETVLKENWLFVRRDDAFAAIYSENGLAPSRQASLKEKELISPGINTTWFVKVAARPEIDDFETFVRWMAENTPERKNGKFVFRDFEYGMMEFDLM